MGCQAVPEPLLHDQQLAPTHSLLTWIPLQLDMQQCGKGLAYWASCVRVQRRRFAWSGWRQGIAFAALLAVLLGTALLYAFVAPYRAPAAPVAVAGHYSQVRALPARSGRRQHARSLAWECARVHACVGCWPCAQEQRFWAARSPAGGAEQPPAGPLACAQFTLVTMSYQARMSTLRPFVRHYSRCPSVAEIVLVWNKGEPCHLPAHMPACVHTQRS